MVERFGRGSMGSCWDMLGRGRMGAMLGRYFGGSGRHVWRSQIIYSKQSKQDSKRANSE